MKEFIRCIEMFESAKEREGFVEAGKNRMKKTRRVGRILRVVLGFALAGLLLSGAVQAHDAPEGSFGFSHLRTTRVPIASVEVVRTYPHDPGAFTQGLFFHRGFFFESTGLAGRSSLTRRDVATGKILDSVSLAGEYFGEGLVLFQDRIYQLTWQNETVFIYDARTFCLLRKLRYSGEGWGLTTDGRRLLMSNGTSTLTFRDPGSFKILRKIHAQDGETPVDRLNELEFVRGEIWANVFTTDLIVRISPKDGRVKGWIDLSVLRSYLPAHASVDVLNGIAWDAGSGRLFVTGKYWPYVFEIRLSGTSGRRP